MKIEKLLLHLFTVTLILFLSKAALGRPVIPSLEVLTKYSDLIVVAQVQEVVEETPKAEEILNLQPVPNGFRRMTILRDKLRVASIGVLDTWKGSTGDKLQFRASKSYMCDISNAVVGETVVLFLKNEKDSPLMSIAFSGYGRMPVKDNSVFMYRHLLTKERKVSLGFSAEANPNRLELAVFKQQIHNILEPNDNSGD